jgi:polysaccharide biosynthesis transport protein
VAPADAPLLHDGDGQALGESDLQMLLLCAAVDAGLPDSGALMPEQLRHTAVAWLVREGLRFADLPRRFGRIDARALADLAALVAEMPRRHGDEIDPLMPALRVPPASRDR